MTESQRPGRLRFNTMRTPLLLLVAGVVGVSGCSDLPAAVDVPTTVVESEATSTTTLAPTTTSTAVSTTTTTVPVVAGDCTVSSVLTIGVNSEEVRCLERHLIDRGWLTQTADAEFDEQTRIAVRTFQANHDPKLGIVIDGIAGQQTLELLQLWLEPPSPDPDESTCEGLGDGAVIDREYQRAWLCAGDAISYVFPVTSAWDQPDPGDYEVVERSREASSILTGSYSEMSHFVVFTYGKFRGARVGFHSVPIYPSGEYVQPLDSVGTSELRGDTSGCIRALPDDAVLIWDHLDFGATVKVIS
mgnify:FL=1